MKLDITIKMDNAAFEDDGGAEAARILRELANKIDGHPHFSEGHSNALYDANGNEVGTAIVN